MKLRTRKPPDGPPPAMPDQAPSSSPKAAVCVLTSKEREVLKLRAKGLAYKQIADQLHISPHTVKNHLESIHHKLGVHNTIEAINAVVREGLSLE